MARTGRSFPSRRTKFLYSGGTITPPTGTLTLTGYAPALTTTITPPARALTLTGLAPIIQPVVTPGAAALTLTGKVPSLFISQITPAAGVLVLTGFVPSLTTTITPGIAALVLTGFAPTVTRSITPGAGALTLTGFAPGLTTTITPSLGALTLTGFAPSLTTTITPGAAALTLTGFAPALQPTLPVPQASLTLTGFAPTSFLSQIVVPVAGLTLTGYTPALTTTITPITPPVAALTLTGNVPTVTLVTTPGTASLVLTGYAPSLTTTLTPGVGALVLTGLAPFLAITQIIVPVAALTLTGKVPTLTTILTPGVAALVLTGLAPLFIDTLSVPVGSLVLTGYAPALIAFSPYDPYGGSGLVRVDVYSAAGAKLSSGPVNEIVMAQYSQKVDEVGTFSFTLPSVNYHLGDLIEGNDVWLYVGGEGLVFKGTILKVHHVRKNADRVMTVSGHSIMRRRLVKIGTNLGRTYDNQALSAVVTSLLSGTTISSGSIGAPATNLTASVGAMTRWAALAKIAQYFQYHLREDLFDSTIDMNTLGSASGLVFQNVTEAEPGLASFTTTPPSFYPITEFEPDGDAFELVNKVYIYGGGDGPTQLNLSYSDRSSPYTIQTEVGPDGQTRYFISDATSIAAYGSYEGIPLYVKEAVPLSNSAAEFKAMANTLYDYAVTYLLQHKDKISSYKVNVAGLKHLVGGVPTFEVGDKARVRYQEKETLLGVGPVTVINVDTNLWLMGYTRTIDKAGSRWSFDAATVDVLAQDPMTHVAIMQAQMQALQTSLKTYTYQAYHYYRDSLDPTHSLIVTVDYDSNVYLLHKARVVARKKGLRSNVSTAASGGGSTTTSAGGSSHSHAFNLGSVSSTGSHRHQMFNYTGSGTVIGNSGTYTNTGVANPPFTASTTHNHSSATTDSANPTTPHSHTVSGASGTESAHVHGMQNHTHVSNLQGTYSSYTTKDSGGADQSFNMLTIGALTQNMYTYETAVSHTHAITGSTNTAESAHTHTVTPAPHSHTLTYGIYVDPSPPASPGYGLKINGVDRTGALGGPWNTDFTVDVTTYLVDGSGQPLRQDNSVEITCTTGVSDVEVTVRSLASASAIIPV